MSIAALVPNADGSVEAHNGVVTNWGADAYSYVDEYPTPNDDDYIATSGSASSSYAERTFNCANPGLAGIIQNVTVLARCKGHISTANTAKTVIYCNSTKTYGSSVTLNADNNYHDLTASYDTNPATGQPWTWDDINNLEIGVYLYQPGNNLTACSQIYAIVTYIPLSIGGAQIIGPLW